MDGFTPEILALLFAAGLVAGFVDAIAGGGGLITVPALLWAGLPPVQALATNKLQSTFGTLSATWHFARKGHVDIRAMVPGIAFTFAGSAVGTLAVQAVDQGFLAFMVPVLLMAIAAYVALSPRLGQTDAHKRMGTLAFYGVFGLSIGFYDGFFGPGTGSFWSVAFVTLLGFNLVKATAHAKVVNLTSNAASLLFFAVAGAVMWLPGLVMAAGQFVGARLGSGMVIRKGAGLVRPVLFAVCAATTIKLVAEDPEHPLRLLWAWL